MDLRELAPDGSPARHPWELARAAFVLDRLSAAGLSDGSRVLDVGAGDGWLAGELRRAVGCSVTCWDEGYSDDDEGRLRAAGLEACRAPPAGPFDAALLLDVLEHADDDVALLGAVVARVRAGGRLLVTVPAWPALFSEHDRALLHRRRYTPASCRRLLVEGGLRVDEAGGLFHGLLAPRALAVLVERLGVAPRAAHVGIGRWRHGPAVTRALVAGLRAEQRVSALAARHGLELPGLSWFALCTLPAASPWQSGSP
ncbi:MAG: class I SAM-dependent methyltransferase [Deltaproteobacteria bacterium]|nr:class I SAM-dependent methyltransferase [Deltaproteobacteria bacterium]